MFRQGFLLIAALLSLISTTGLAQSIATKGFHCGGIKYEFERLKTRDQDCRLQDRINRSKNIENGSVKRFEQKKLHKFTQIGWVNW